MIEKQPKCELELDGDIPVLEGFVGEEKPITTLVFKKTPIYQITEI